MNLAERCEYLERENGQLRAALQSCDEARYPAKWALSGGEKRILTSLASSPDGFRTHEALRIAGRRHESTASEKLVHVLICRVRNKLRPFGIRIHNVSGKGYKLDPESRSIVQAPRIREIAA